MVAREIGKYAAFEFKSGNAPLVNSVRAAFVKAYSHPVSTICANSAFISIGLGVVCGFYRFVVHVVAHGRK